MRKESTNPPEFDRAMTLLLERLRLPPFQHKSEAYRLRFGDENPVYFVAQGEDWLEILADAGRIDSGKASTIASELLELQLRQGNGALLCIGMDQNSGKVSVRARLLLRGCQADDMLAAMQAVRAQAAAARAVMEGKNAQARPDRGSAASRDSSTLSRMSSLRGSTFIERG
jgi:hypothetical protein